MARDGVRKAREELDALYATLPSIPCQRECWRECGPIFQTRLEWDRVRSRFNPLNLHPMVHGERRTDLCPFLTTEGLCSVYKQRPSICRLYGLTERLKCPLGCVPERWLTDAESGEFLQKVYALSQRAYPNDEGNVDAALIHTNEWLKRR